MMISHTFRSPINSLNLSCPSTISSNSFGCLSFRKVNPHLGRRKLYLQAMFSANTVSQMFAPPWFLVELHCLCFEFGRRLPKEGFFYQKLNRKLVHTSVGLVFMLCWPLFTSGRRGALLAAFIPGINIVKVLLIGLGIVKDEATVKSMSRFGDYRELIKGPLYYASTITLACAIYWRTSSIELQQFAISVLEMVLLTLWEDDWEEKLPYNIEKSYAGSIAMIIASFIASIGFMCYFSMFGYLEESWEMVFGFLVVSVASALVSKQQV